MKYFIPFLMLFLSACSSLQTRSLKDSLAPVKLEGEGRGRIGYFDQNYLFRFESVFKDKDWFLNIAIPMHGQETMIFEGLDKKKSQAKMQSFEEKIDREIKKQTNLEELNEENIISHLRSLVRFAEANTLGLELICEDSNCFLDEELYLVTPTEDGVIVKKDINKNYFVEFSAMYLEGKSYSRTNFYLKKEGSRDNLFSLELFWRNK